MDIQYMPTAKLLPYTRNPRKNDNSVAAVAASIKQFGFRNPIIVDADGTIIAGHTRLKAAKKLGMTKVPVIKVEDLTPDQVNAFRLADNKAQELSSWDFSLLLDELTKIKDIDMSVFGFATEQNEEETERKVRGDASEGRTSNLDEGYEVDVSSFDEETFECQCPECGFKFNEYK